MQVWGRFWGGRRFRKGKGVGRLVRGELQGVYDCDIWAIVGKGGGVSGPSVIDESILSRYSDVTTVTTRFHSSMHVQLCDIIAINYKQTCSRIPLNMPTQPFKTIALIATLPFEIK